MAYKHVMKYHYAIIHNRKHNTLAKLPVPEVSTYSLHFLPSIIYLAREQIDKWDVKNGDCLLRMSLCDCGSHVNKI